MKKALFIDRDGTIIAEPADEQIDSLEKLAFVPGAISALKALTGLGFDLVLATNQDGLGTPSFPEDTFWPAHNKMLATLGGEGVAFDDQLIDRTFPHDNAPTRKPGTGMFGRYTGGEYDLAASYVIGDRATDILLARNLGARGILLAPPAEGLRTLEEAGAADACALITDGRFSGGTSGLSIGHVSPEAASGGSIGLIEDGDLIAIDIPNRGIQLQVSDAELAARREAQEARGNKAWTPKNRERQVSFALRAYASLATSADKGAVRDKSKLGG